MQRKVSQAPLKDGLCHGACGAPIEWRTSPRVYCDLCREARKRSSARASMERQRRKRGIACVKGRLIRCADCRCEIVLNRNSSALRCASCATEKQRKRARRISIEKRQTAEGRKYNNAWRRERSKSDPAWRVSAHMRVLIHRGLGKKKAGRSWRKFVPYTLDQLMSHLQRQFLPGMRWENQGEWHIDHIQPLSRFRFESPADPEFQAAWALTNLRPLWGGDNIKKSNKRTLLL